MYVVDKTKDISIFDSIKIIRAYPPLAVKEHDATEPGKLCVYTDGSSIDGHVGAATPYKPKLLLRRFARGGLSIRPLEMSEDESSRFEFTGC